MMFILLALCKIPVFTMLDGLPASPPRGRGFSMGRNRFHQQKVRWVRMSALQNFPRITPFLWFDSNAEEAVDFYLTVFKNSRRLDELRTIDDRRGPKGSILTIAFELDGQKFTALNGGPMFKFTEAVSFVVRCDSQQEVDDYWSKLSAGGSESSVRLAQGQVRPFLADRARAAARTHQTPEGDAGHAADEEARHRGARTRRAIVVNYSYSATRTMLSGYFNGSSPS